MPSRKTRGRLRTRRQTGNQAVPRTPRDRRLGLSCSWLLSRAVIRPRRAPLDTAGNARAHPTSRPTSWAISNITCRCQPNGHADESTGHSTRRHETATSPTTHHPWARALSTTVRDWRHRKRAAPTSTAIGPSMQRRSSAGPQTGDDRPARGDTRRHPSGQVSACFGVILLASEVLGSLPVPMGVGDDGDDSASGGHRAQLAPSSRANRFCARQTLLSNGSRAHKRFTRVVWWGAPRTNRRPPAGRTRTRCRR